MEKQDAQRLRYRGIPLNASAFIEMVIFLLPINHLRKRRTETAEKPIELDLGFTSSETASFLFWDKNRSSTHLG